MGRWLWFARGWTIRTGHSQHPLSSLLGEQAGHSNSRPPTGTGRHTQSGRRPQFLSCLVESAHQQDGTVTGDPASAAEPYGWLDCLLVSWLLSGKQDTDFASSAQR